MTKLPQKLIQNYVHYGISKRGEIKYIFIMVMVSFLALHCVDMPDIRVLEINNRPPVINKSTINPSTPVVKADATCKKEFSFSEVTELDTEDMLYVRWYVDYEYLKNYQKSSIIQPANKSNITRGGDNFTLDLKNSILPNKSRGSIHTVEVIISDRPFVLDSTEPPAFKAIEAGGNYDYLSWTVIQIEDCY